MSPNDANIENHIRLINNHFNPSSNNILLEKQEFNLSLNILIKNKNSKCIRKIITKMYKDTNRDTNQNTNLLRLCNAINNLIFY